MTAVTAITAQNSYGVQGVHVVPPATLEQQLDSVLGDLGADVVKTGMLADAATVEVRASSRQLLFRHQPAAAAVVVEAVLYSDCCRSA
jgi:hydroxymethylpyrimidine/phosphomethylpyrimidine kinase